MLDKSFLSNAIKLITATSFSQIIGIFMMPLLTRIYLPETFGLLQIFISITFLIVPLSTCNYEVAILIPEDDEDAISLVWSTIMLAGIAMAFFYLFISFSHNWVLQILNAEKLGRFIYILPISVFSMAVFSTASFWLMRKNNFGLIALCNGFQALVSQGVKLVFGFLTNGLFIALISGNIIADLTQVILALTRYPIHTAQLFRNRISWVRIKTNLKKYKRFPMYSLPAKFLYQASAELPVFMMAYFFSPIILGYYALGRRLLWMPLSIISSAISRVLLQQATSKRDDQRGIAVLSKKILDHLTLISIFPFALLGLTAPEIFSCVFGKEWREAGVFTSLLCIWGAVSFVFSPFFELTNAFQKQHSFLIYNIGSLMVRFLSLLVGGILSSPLIAVGLLSISASVITVCFGLIVLSYVSLNAGTIQHIVLKNMQSAIIALIPVVFIKLMKLTPIILFISVPASCILFLILIMNKQPEIFTEIRELVFSKGSNQS